MPDFTFSELLWFYLGQPWVFALLAFVLCCVVLVLRMRRGSRGPALELDTAVPLVLRWTACALLVLWAFRATLPWVSSVFWGAGLALRWVFPPFSELILLVLPSVIAMVGLMCFEYSQRKQISLKEEPGFVAERRYWHTYLGQAPIAAATSLLGALAVLAIWAGVGSTKDPEGWFIGTPVAGNDRVTGSAPTFGWTYGVPSFTFAVLLVVIGIIVLRRRALAPFPAAMAQSDQVWQRRVNAAGVSQLIISVLGLVLGSAFAIIGFGARSELSYEIPSSGESGTWGTSFAAFSDPALAIWLILTVCSLALLLLLVVTGRPLGFGRIASGRAAASQGVPSERSNV
ncbi:MULTISPECIES: hypothetical protein [unclassified Leucobacter]|uniref:hypothetical protein n=1 Tax=unclassified Leucobacter TaxID=2621730 RepID=UPI00165DFBDD|nr:MULTISPECIES: hypothetical protein [unclassified Leucobacter]MBC9936962.1 hypothetical protein [Leucobacter sp. cx-87]